VQPQPSREELAEYRNIFWLLYALQQNWSGAKVRDRMNQADFWTIAAQFQSQKEFAYWHEATKRLFLGFDSAELVRFQERSKRHLEHCQKYGMRVVTPAENEYPHFHEGFASRPYCFHVLGPRLTTAAKKHGIIGTRKPSLTGVKVAFYLGRKLSMEGAEVFSGGAYGCDIAALRGSLDSRTVPSRTSIVFPSGLANLRPKGLFRTFEHVKDAGGRWISPFLYDHEPRKYDYLARNRFLAKFIDELYVVEAPGKSGSMSTATACARRNVPIKVWSPRGIIPSGNASLLQDYGAEGFRVELQKNDKHHQPLN